MISPAPTLGERVKHLGQRNGPLRNPLSSIILWIDACMLLLSENKRMGILRGRSIQAAVTKIMRSFLSDFPMSTVISDRAA